MRAAGARKARRRKPVPKAKPKKAPEDVVEIFDKVEQRSRDWYELRLGIPTASVFATVMASGKDGGDSLTRADLLRRLAGEILTGRPDETRFKSEAMQRGIDMEPAARDYYSRTRLVELELVGFVRRTIHNPFGEAIVVGCSPDAFVGKGRRKLLQIKTMNPQALIELLEKGAGGFPREHRAQCHGELFVSGGAELDLMFFYEGMPIAPTFTVQRDEFYIKEIKEACEVFTFDLRTLVKKIRSMGPKR